MDIRVYNMSIWVKNKFEEFKNDPTRLTELADKVAKQIEQRKGVVVI
jgi:hypothetical protein